MIHIKPEMTDERINEIKALIRDNPGWNRTILSKRLCEKWDWKSPVGQIKDISCRDLLRMLDEKGIINLPAAQRWPRAPGVGADKIVTVEHKLKTVDDKLDKVTPIRIETVTTQDVIRLFKTYIHKYHYLGYNRSIGEGMKYFVYGNGGDILACMMFGSSAWSCKARDEYIGWDTAQRRAGLHMITNNSRFLILPGIKVPHLASHILGAISRRISSDWQVKYGHRIYLLETFVESQRFRGVCYRAANWKYVGQTAGMGRNCKTAAGELPTKDIYVYPLAADFREQLATQERLGSGNEYR
jgi:hypothetical protein